MFLKEVYRHSKLMFAGFLFFIVLQLAINVKRGMVFTPFLHYGMYSWVQKPRHEYWVNRVITYRDTLRGGNYSPQAWDKIYYTLDELYATSCQQSFFSNQVQRLYAKARLPIPESNKFLVGQTPAELLEAYKKWLPSQINLNKDSIRVVSNKFIYHFGRLVYQPMDSLYVKPPMICP